MTLKNTGHRTTPRVRTPEEQRKHRAEQAARAIAAGRNEEHNWLRIERHLRDVPVKLGYFAGMAIPEAIQESAWPTTAPTESNRPAA